MNTLQSKNIILIYKIKRTREVGLADLFWFIDYGYRLASVQNSVSQSREQCRSESICKMTKRNVSLYRTVSVRVNKQNDQAKKVETARDHYPYKV